MITLIAEAGILLTEADRDNLVNGDSEQLVALQAQILLLIAATDEERLP